MTDCLLHYDGCEIRCFALSKNFVTFVPINDLNSAYIFRSRRLLQCVDEKTLANIKPVHVCSEARDIKIVKHYEYGNIVYVLTYDDSNLRILRSRCDVNCVFDFSEVSQCLMNSVSSFDLNPGSFYVFIASLNNVYKYAIEESNELSLIGYHARNVVSTKVLSIKYVGSLDESDICKIWNMDTLTLRFAITLSRVSAFTFLNDVIFYGTNDGQIFSVSTLVDRRRPEYIITIPPFQRIPKDIEKKPASKGSTRKTWNIVKDVSKLSLSDEAASEILAMKFCSSDGSRLCLVTASGIHTFNVLTRRFDQARLFSDMTHSNWFYATRANFCVLNDFVLIALESINDRCVFASFEKPVVPDIGLDVVTSALVDGDETSELSFLAKTGLSESSALGRALNRLNPESKPKSSSAAFQSGSTIRYLNANISHPGSHMSFVSRPVMFGHSVRSSGYAQVSRTTMFKPRINKLKAKGCTKGSTAKLTSRINCSYPSDTEPSLECLLSEHIETEPTPTFSLSYSPLGDRVAVGQGNGLCSIVRRYSPSERGDGGWRTSAVLGGHGGAVWSAEWSLDAQLVLTTAADRTARIWSASDGGALRLLVSSPRGGAANALGMPLLGKEASKNSKIPSEFVDNVQFGRFHLQDNFFHLTCRNEVFFFSFKIDSKANAIQKCHRVASYKPVAKFTLDNCTRLTAVSSANIFYSYLLVTAGSDRSLYILDINTAQIVRNIPATHAATITGIDINQGSLYSSFASSGLVGCFGDAVASYSLYATAAPGDSVRLWDLRLHSRGHVAELASCRALFPSAAGTWGGGGAVRDATVPPVSVVFGPCGRRVCFGALGGGQHLAPAVVDIRKACSPLASLVPRGRRPVASTAATVVAWSPLKPEITTGALDGRLSLFG